MSKATPIDIEAIGFSAHQFGNPADWLTESPAGYLQKILDDVALEVRTAAGASIYDAATVGTLTEARLRSAEMYLTAARLWRRLEMWERQNAAAGRESDQVETLGSRMLTNAEEFEDRGWSELSLVTGASRTGGVSATTVETGPYDAVT